MNLAGYCAAMALGLVVTGFEQPQQSARPREQVVDLTTAPTVLATPSVPLSRQLTLQVPVSASPHSESVSRIRAMPPELDRSDYRLGEPFFFDVVVQNASSAPLEVPTLPDGGNIDRQMPGAAMASVGLTFDDEVLGPQTVSPQFLYGARDVPGSLVTLQPHEFLRIRAQGRWIMSSSTGTPKANEWPRSLKVKAVVTVVGNGVVQMFDTSQAASHVVLRLPNR